MKHDIHTVKKAINGDARTFEELLFQEEKMLYYKALSYVGTEEDALDVIQETACKAFLAIGKLREQIVPYEEHELLKRLDEKQEKEIESFHLTEALSTLNSSYQTSIILFYYHDLSIQDISDVMEKPVSTVKTYLRRAKKKLRSELERSYKLNERIS
ncbi:sigma-70 family RNA polymerase sigma factor [Priestia megaterium]